MAVHRVISIEITDACTKLCEMGYGKKNPYIFRSMIFDNPEQSVDDGFILNRSSYVNIVKEQLQIAGIKCKNVVFALASNKIISRDIVIPEMKEKLVHDYLEEELFSNGYIQSYYVISYIGTFAGREEDAYYCICSTGSFD